MKVGVLAILVATALTVGGRMVAGQRAAYAGMGHAGHAANSAAGAAIVSRLVLPTEAATKMLLEGAVHNSEFVSVQTGREQIRAFVSYPDRADKAPVVLVTAKDQRMSDWTRAVAFQASRHGFIAIVPDYLSDAVRQFAAQIPAANGTIASIELGDGRIAARVGSSARETRFAFSDQGWANALMFLSAQTGNRFEPLAHTDHVLMEMRAHPSTVARGALSEVEGQQAGRGAQAGQLRQTPGLSEKPADLPANWVMAERVIATTPRRNEWVDVPAGNAKVHTWIVYPAGNERVGAVLVLHGASGVTDWIRAVADQLAQEGFLALVPDMSSGLGPNGGNYDSFRFMDDRMRATGKLGRENTMARINGVRDYAAKLPLSNGKTGSIGFCGGGTNSFTLATDVPGHNASVVFYGGPPPPASLGKATAPVIGFYGEDDVRIASTVEPTRVEMKRLRKAYEAHLYPHTTHSFLWMQDLGNNFDATADAWPRAVAFLRQHLNTPAPSTR